MSMNVCFVGVCNLDLYSCIQALPNSGETVIGTSLQKGFGGKAANSCVQFSYLSQNPPKLLSAVGKDSDGELMLNYYKNKGITGIVKTDSPTGLAICFVIGKGDSAIVIHPCQIPDSIISHDSLQGYGIIVTNFEAGYLIALKTLKIGHDLGAITILCATPNQDQIDHEIFKYSTYLIVNEFELNSINSNLFEFGVKAIIETHGENGAVIKKDGKPPQIIKTRKSNVVDTTGAGDSFVGAFCYYLSLKKTLEEAVEFGCIVASISVETVGTQLSYCNCFHPELSNFYVP